MQELALGQLGWTIDQFWDATPRELVNAMRGFNKVQEARERSEWERTRWQTAALLTPNLKKGAKLKPTDLITFPWEEKARKKLTPEQIAERLKRL